MKHRNPSIPPGSPIGSSSKRLLVLTYHFPPDGSVGGLRWAGLSKYLARRGWEVHIITASAQIAVAPPAGVTVHVCARTATLNDRYNHVARRLRARRRLPEPGAPSSVARPSSAAGRWLSAIRREFAACLAFPDYARGWVFRAAGEARTLLRDKEFTAVVSSGPPHSAHLAAVLATVGRPNLLTLDLRDPWAGVMDKAWGKRLYDSVLARTLIPLLERLAFSRAALAIANTPVFAQSLRKAHPALEVGFLPNGIDPDRLPQAINPEDGSLTLAYVGTLYAGRDLTPVLAGMRAFLDGNPEVRSKLRLRVAGQIDGVHGDNFRQQIRVYGLEDYVEILGVLPPGNALDVLNASHLAIVLAQDQQMQVPAKIYECVGLHLPTLVITEDTSAAAEEARRIGAFVRQEDDTAGIVGLLEDLWYGRISPRSESVSAIGYEGLAARMEGLLLGAEPEGPPIELSRGNRSEAHIAGGGGGIDTR